MDIYLKSFNGFSLNNANYKSAVIKGKKPADASAVYISQTNADAEDAGVYTRSALPVPIYVSVIGPNRNQLESQLKEALMTGTGGELVITFTDENRDYSKFCRVISIEPSEKYVGVYTIVLQTGESAWRAVSEDTAAWAITGSGSTKTITVGGCSETALSFEMSPQTVPAGGYAYQKLYQLVNVPLINFGARPWKITVDTAALVAAGKMQADCDDLAIVIDGQIVKRWITDPNTDHTGVWFNVSLMAGVSLTLNAALTSSAGITELVFAKTTANAAGISALPTRGYLVHGTEWIEYNGKKSNYSVIVTKRGAMGTTKQDHASLDVFKFVQHSILMLYGSASATDPAADDPYYDSEKPVFDLTASTNSSWVYTASTLFYDPLYPTRPGSWKPVVKRVGDVSNFYTTAGNVAGAAPSMGMLLATYTKLGKPAAEAGVIEWQFNHPGKLYSITYTGRKYKATAAWTGATSAQFRCAAVAGGWGYLFYDAQPTAIATWEAISRSNYLLPGNQTWIEFMLSGSLAAAAGAAGYYEIQTLTVNFVGANQPAGTMLEEKAALVLAVTIENTTNGDRVGVMIPLLLYSTLVGDGESHALTLDGENAQAGLVIIDKGRSTWIRLAPGENVISVSGDNVGQITSELSWKVRRI
ncbi:hypothetical protein hrd7_25440 [Leptolinea sp. HRD-7]|nr:hypothetical protein hrd7_25440 [Leptolinea sp. HRD-7]